jgi:hypothetical protein
MSKFIRMFFLIFALPGLSQQGGNDSLPFASIPDYPPAYSAQTVTARMIDGLGFRYYWATEGIRDEDLIYRPGDSGRSFRETMEHVYNLSLVILNAARKQGNDPRSLPDSIADVKELRHKTLDNIETASKLLATSTNLGEHPVRFISASGEAEFPFWNLINGPIADAIWHCGQLVVLRRASGNPVDPEVSFLQGKRNSASP